jgi:hypothetical protein
MWIVSHHLPQGCGELAEPLGRIRRSFPLGLVMQETRSAKHRFPESREKSASLLIGIRAAVNHSNPAERVTVQEALELYTINATRIAFQEQDRGSLEVSKLADFVVLAQDPFDVDRKQIKDIPVEMTVMGRDMVCRREH